MLMFEDRNRLSRFAEEIRLEVLKAFKHLGFGHVGGSMSIIETLAVLYGEVMNIDPIKPRWEDRDWLVMSKGHSGPALYATLALRGFFSKEELITLNQPRTNLPSHCDRNKTPGIDMTTGSLGQGISIALGIALGNRLDNRSNYTYLILGDGECDEGQIWEGVLFAAHYKLDNIIAFVDYNKQQLDGYISEVMDLGDLTSKFEAFGWHAQDVDGNNVETIYEAVMKAKVVKGKPHVIILNTKKGFGCSFAEGILSNHHMVVTAEQAEDAILCVKKRLAKLQSVQQNG